MMVSKRLDLLINLEREDLIKLMLDYDDYIANANEEDFYQSGWMPVGILEFYNNEFIEDCKTCGNQIVKEAPNQDACPTSWGAECNIK